MTRIYTDGAWRRREKAAGAAAIIIWKNGKMDIHHKYLGDATNNRAELQAIKLALEKMLAYNKGRLASSNITIYSDSTYAIGILTEGWKARANQELIAEISELMKAFPNLTFKWVKAHSRNKYNRMADLAANIAIDQHFNRDTIDWLPDEPDFETGINYEQ